MNARKKALRTGAVFIALFIIGGLLLMYKGNDALALATEKKEGILTAEQVKLSFDSVSGRLVHLDVKEGDEVKAGDVIMELDSTDTDLAIEKLQAQIAQLDAQIRSTGGTQNVNFMKADTDETQNNQAINQQQAAVDSAQATLKNAQIDYNRKVMLVNAGAIAQSQLDDAEMKLNTSEAAVEQQQRLLEKLQAGTNGSDSDTIAQERQSAANMSNDIDSLTAQKASLEAQLKQLQVNKERLILRAPEDGKIVKVLVKEGEMINASTPVALLESNRDYYDIYISEEQAAGLSEGDAITGTTVAGKKQIPGTIQLITKAQSFADLKQSREKGQADLTSYQVRIYTDPDSGAVPGMTIGVSDDEFTKR